MAYSNVIYQKFDSQRRFGVELEMDEFVKKPKIRSLLKSLSNHGTYTSRYELSGDAHVWHIKDDSTCGSKGKKGPRGIEVASFVAQGTADLKHIAEVADGLSRAGCKVNDNCGMHIHAEAKDLTSSDIAIILAHWIKIEPILSLAMPPSRNNNEYCRFYLDRCKFSETIRKKANEQWDALSFLALTTPQNLGYYENEDRRVTLNLVNFSRALYYDSNNRKTIELRWPEGTLNGVDIKCWVRLFLNFIENCKSLKMPKNLLPCDLDEFLRLFGLNHKDENFVILSEALHETKTWLLERFVKYSDNENVFNEAKIILNRMWYPIKNYK
jgi:hypothetical protein